MKRTVLLTGGAGFIGSHVAVSLLSNGHRVVIIDSLINSQASVIQRIEELSGTKLEFVLDDIRNTARVIATISEAGVDSVIHLAGLKAVAEAVEDPLSYFSANIAGALSLITAMNETGVKNLIFSSSATVYGQPEYLPMDEKHPIRALNPYGRCKIHIEEYLNDIVNADPEWRTVCLRYFNPVGAHDSGLIGELPSGIPNNLMPRIADAIQYGRELLIFGDDYPTPDGTGVRDYLHVSDLAQGHLAALAYTDTHAGWHAFNLGTGRGSSVLEVIKYFEAMSGEKVPYRFAPRRAGDAAECFADVALSQKKLGWKSVFELEDMCRSYWNFRQKNQAGNLEHETLNEEAI